jgi:hypothetical protein
VGVKFVSYRGRKYNIKAVEEDFRGTEGEEVRDKLHNEDLKSLKDQS